LFLGERATALKWVADGFVKLLQMTVLPYVTLSIIGSLGTLQMASAKRLAWHAGVVLVSIWAIALTFALLIPLTFPRVQSASFFSTTLVEQRPPFNFVDLYIPANPFYSLANNIVPAVVLFSIVVGIALIGITRKQPLLDMLSIATETLSRATRFIVQLTPYGLFAIAATTAGTISLEQVGRLQVYLVAYVVVSLLMSLWVLPGLVSALTPIRMRDMFSLTRDALITAFVVGDLFIVLPVLITAARTLVDDYGLATGPEANLPDVIVPASFNFPHTGKLLSLSFVLFAGWFADAVVPLSDYARLAFTGLVTSFGSLNVAVPFLLDQFRIPADTFQLFLASSVVNSRFGTLVAAIHALVVALLGTCAMTGALRWQRRRLLRYAVVTLVLTTVTIGGTRLLFARVVPQTYTKDQVLSSMHVSNPVRAVVHRDPAPLWPKETGSLLGSIKARGVLRVGYLPSSLPYAYFNTHNELVGLDVAMAHRLASELHVTLEFVPLDLETWQGQVESGMCDIVMSGAFLTTLRASRTLFATSYLDETLAMVVLDSKRARFTEWEAIRAMPHLRVAVRNLPYYWEKARELLPDATLQPFVDFGELISSPTRDFDAILFPAERGSAWTLIYPEYTVVVPQPSTVRVPLAYAIAKHDQEFRSFIDSWVELKKKDGTVAQLYDYWVLGRDAEPAKPRWSIIRNVLHWVQ
jgi:Na+/H+-dicarboxylate symporter/ABC-type amino acid transport substrate-binding protein